MPGLLVFVGWTPLLFMSKREGAVEATTYGAEFSAIHNTVEEPQVIHIMLFRYKDGRRIVYL